MKMNGEMVWGNMLGSVRKNSMEGLKEEGRKAGKNVMEIREEKREEKKT